MQLSAIATREK